MHGNKYTKNKRLRQMLELIQRAGEISQAALARALGVSRSVVNKDLVTLHARGVRLAEDDDGKLSFPD